VAVFFVPKGSFHDFEKKYCLHRSAKFVILILAAKNGSAIAGSEAFKKRLAITLPDVVYYKSRRSEPSQEGNSAAASRTSILLLEN
jgi:hypothetical protein